MTGVASWPVTLTTGEAGVVALHVVSRTPSGVLVVDLRSPGLGSAIAAAIDRKMTGREMPQYRGRLDLQWGRRDTPFVSWQEHPLGFGMLQVGARSGLPEHAGPVAQLFDELASEVTREAPRTVTVIARPDSLGLPGDCRIRVTRHADGSLLIESEPA